MSEMIGSMSNTPLHVREELEGNEDVALVGYGSMEWMLIFDTEAMAEISTLDKQEEQ